MGETVEEVLLDRAATKQILAGRVLKRDQLASRILARVLGQQSDAKSEHPLVEEADHAVHIRCSDRLTANQLKQVFFFS